MEPATCGLPDTGIFKKQRSRGASRSKAIEAQDKLAYLVTCGLATGANLKQFAPEPLSMAYDANDNFVLQKVIAFAGIELIAWICSHLRGDVVSMACDRAACRIVCRLIEQCQYFSCIRDLLSEMQGRLLIVAKHHYGHYVIEALVEHWPAFPGLNDLFQSCVDLTLNRRSHTFWILVRAIELGRLPDSVKTQLCCDQWQSRIDACCPERAPALYMKLHCDAAPSQLDVQVSPKLEPAGTWTHVFYPGGFLITPDGLVFCAPGIYPQYCPAIETCSDCVLEYCLEERHIRQVKDGTHVLQIKSDVIYARATWILLVFNVHSLTPKAGRTFEAGVHARLALKRVSLDGTSAGQLNVGLAACPLGPHDFDACDIFSLADDILLCEKDDDVARLSVTLKPL